MTLTGVLQGQVPFECKRLFPNYEHHRQTLKDSVREQLFNDNKRLLKLRVLADGWVADWEEIVPGQNGSCTSYSRMHQVSPAIATKLEPVGLTLWDDGKHEFKQDTECVESQATSIPKPEPTELVSYSIDPSGAPRHLPQHPSLDMHVDCVDQHRIDIQTANGQLPARPTALLPEDENLVHPPRLGTPTGPRNRKINPDAPYPPRRPLIFQRESASSNHRYIRSDQPGSLQLHRLTLSRPAVRGIDRTRLTRRERAERGGYREEDERDRRSYWSEEDRRPSKRVALEDQQSVYRRTMERGRGRRTTEQSHTNAASTSYPTRTQEQSMQIDDPVTPQLDLAEDGLGLVPPINNAEEEATLFIPERPTSPDVDHAMLEEDHATENITVPDGRNVPLKNMAMDASVLVKVPDDDDDNDELVSSSSSSSEDSSKETKTLPARNRVSPKAQPKGAAELLASINFASVRDMLHEPTSAPNPPPPPSRPAPQMFNRPLDRKPPIIRTARPSTFTSATTSQPPYAKPLQSSSSKRAPVSPDPDSDSDSNLKTKVNLKSKMKAPRQPPTPPPRLSMQYRHAEIVKLPKPDYARARRLLAPLNKPLVCVSMPGDVQFVRDDERVRVEGWLLPAPARPKGGEGKKVAYVVTDACLLGDSNVVMVHETGPHPASIICIPDDYDDVPVRHNLSHALAPAASIQRRGILSSVCALDSQRFFTGCMDKRVLLWDIGGVDKGAPKVSIEALDITHGASVRTLAYGPSRSWLVSAAGAKVAVTDVSTGQAVLKAGKQKWASNDVFNVHFHSRDPNMLLVETGDLDKQARIYDLRKIQKTGLAPERLIGSTETGAISQYVRGDWAKSLVVRPSNLNMVKVWDTRQPDRPLSVHTLSHTITHCIFIDDCRTIAATGEHFVTFLDARV